MLVRRVVLPSGVMSANKFFEGALLGKSSGVSGSSCFGLIPQVSPSSFSFFEPEGDLLDGIELSSQGGHLQLRGASLYDHFSKFGPLEVVDSSVSDTNTDILHSVRFDEGNLGPAYDSHSSGYTFLGLDPSGHSNSKDLQSHVDLSGSVATSGDGSPESESHGANNFE